MNDIGSRTSRRVFLQTALAAAAVKTTLGDRTTVRARTTPDRERERIERIVREYGSEIGGLRRILEET